MATKVWLEKYSCKKYGCKSMAAKVWLQKYGCKVWLQPNFIDQSQGKAKCGKTNKKRLGTCSRPMGSDSHIT
jgi:hypothetical protein